MSRRRKGAPKRKRTSSRKTSTPKKPSKHAVSSISIFRRARLAPTRKVDGSGIFSRVAPPPTHFPSGAVPRWDAWGAQRGGSFLGEVPSTDPDRFQWLKAQNVFDHLVRLDVDPAIAAELANIDANGTYVVRARVRGGSGVSGAGGNERGAMADEHHVVFVGRGQRLWQSFLGLCDPHGGASELLDIEIWDAPSGQKDEAFPVWSGETARTDGGDDIEGTGQRHLWEMRRAAQAKKHGRRRKSGGGMTADERRTDKARAKQRKKRERNTRERIRQMFASGDIAGARQLQRKSEAGKRASKRKPKPGKGRTR